MDLSKTLLYAGLDKEEMRELLPEALRENGRFLRIYSIFASGVFIACLAASLIAGGQLNVNKPIYMIMIVLNVLIYMGVKTVMRKRPSLSTPLSVAFILGMYGYSFAVSLIHTGMQGTAAVAILVVMPCIFIYRPIYMVSLTVLMGSLYCFISAQIKSHDIAMLDLWNTLFFGMIAVLLSIYQMQVRFREMQKKRQNRILSETDLSTGVKNRNCYENNQDYYAKICAQSVTCVYVDVNGLHELNDQEGHESGDIMLKAVGSAMAERFGKENVYRIGGDEFVAFCPDAAVEKTRASISSMISELTGKGYSVSVGAYLEEKSRLDIKVLVREAEKCMYKEKRQYYEQFSHDRRQRRNAAANMSSGA
ncbi:MAG: diguanylate cyclase [Clostridia bacterium]|nr:diguanylate cyclase [Clostridia bacterium]